MGVTFNGEKEIIFSRTLKKIDRQIDKTLCKIIFNKKGENQFDTATGFLCKIPFPDTFNLKPVLITCNHVLKEKDILPYKKIEFTMNDDKNTRTILIDELRRTYTSPEEEYDTTIIEIKDEDGLDFKSFLEIDDFYENDKEIKDSLKDKNIYIIHYPLENGTKWSIGLITCVHEDKVFNFEHNNEAEEVSSGCPVINHSNYKVIGIHKRKENNGLNIGTILQFPIKDFYNRQKINKKTITDKDNNADYVVEDLKLYKISGILNLFLIMWILKSLNEIEKIKSTDIKNIIRYLKENIILKKDKIELSSSNLKNNILAYSNYINFAFKENDINDLFGLLDAQQKSKIIGFCFNLFKFKDINELFEKELIKSLEISYFEYSIIDISIDMQANIEKFKEAQKNCPNCILKSLFHGTRKEIVIKILKDGFLLSKRNFFGMGIYFTDMLDYVLFYSGGNSLSNHRENWGKILPPGGTFSFVGTEVFYDKKKIKYVYKPMKEESDNFLTYEEIKEKFPEKIIEKNGINIAKIDLVQGRTLKPNEIKKNEERKNILGVDYAVSEKEQTLPLYGITLKRNEFLVVWKDSNYEINNDYKEYFEQAKFIINKEFNINVYIKNSTKKALEIIETKKYNKIILISDINEDLKEKAFIEDAREILGFEAMVLFLSNKLKNLEWLKEFPNALFSNDISFYEKYIKNYNETGLYNLKKEVEEIFNINLKFTENILEFNKYIKDGDYENLYLNDFYFDNFNNSNDLNKDISSDGKNIKSVGKNNDSSDGKNIKSVGKNIKSVGKNIKPVGKNIKPVEKNIKPVGKNIKPVEKNIKPVGKNIKPVGKNIKSVEKNIKPVGKNIKPVEKNIKTVEKNIKPVGKNIKPVGKNIK